MEKHKHIPFKHGTITWTGDGHPSEEMMQVFNLMAEKAIKKADSEIDTCECKTPYFPTGDKEWCSKCNKPTVY